MASQDLKTNDDTLAIESDALRANLLETATDEAIDASIEAGEEKPLVAGHLREALNEVRPTTLEWLTSLSYLAITTAAWRRVDGA